MTSFSPLHLPIYIIYVSICFRDPEEACRDLLTTIKRAGGQAFNRSASARIYEIMMTGKVQTTQGTRAGGGRGRGGSRAGAGAGRGRGSKGGVGAGAWAEDPEDPEEWEEEEEYY